MCLHQKCVSCAHCLLLITFRYYLKTQLWEHITWPPGSTLRMFWIQERDGGTTSFHFNFPVDLPWNQRYQHLHYWNHQHHLRMSLVISSILSETAEDCEDLELPYQIPFGPNRISISSKTCKRSASNRYNSRNSNTRNCKRFWSLYITPVLITICNTCFDHYI